ncbi:cytochrome P450 [Mycobacterium gordonae]|uniref:Cytochrome P450 n=1 Tax=Mycobacterium gordonae TaxID=1778 RepID=A0A1A6BF66_MYCGO|nr:cytochrome P450 [Mycobacterium gordonae]MBI2698424.1 cytochrome P450 [Mycobacterium sp.]MCQ4362322.1 cytochrome P450 [Mycobacterium gordonae]MCV7006161.1 cytochrome P450 [Mycobacterium gordonae]OBS00911.1 cytochrome P450 [Mycobacterium gordonae]ODR23289.1 cytochrome P450 [Mycobacterium gordonae]
MAARPTTEPVLRPPVVPIPGLMVAVAFLTARRAAVRALGRRYGDAFTVRLPVVGQVSVFGNPAMVREVLSTKDDLIRPASHVGSVFGPGSTVSLHGAELRQRRRLLLPVFHGKRMAAYEAVVEEEVLRETAGWVPGQPFATLPSMTRITLNAILRTVFGAEGAEFERLRQSLPAMVADGSRLALLPQWARRDFGRWSPGGRFTRQRRRYDEVIAQLIAKARNDPNFHERSDVLSLLLAARYEEGGSLTDDHIADELFTLLAAGHETTSATLAWAVERLRRHPQLLARLTAEADRGQTRLLQATVWEVQRTHPVIQGLLRVTRARVRLGEWVIPENQLVAVSMVLCHSSDRNFPDADEFNPDRFVDNPPDMSVWVPFGAGTHRCVGAAFANMEMIVVLRTLLRHFDLRTTDAAGEWSRSRGVTNAPWRGGRAVVFRRARHDIDAMAY